MSTKEYYSFGGTLSRLKSQDLIKIRMGINKQPTLPSTHLVEASFIRNLRRRNNFEEGDRTKIPLVILGEGMFHKDGVPLKGQLHGVTSIIYNNLKRRERIGELCLIDINEFRTSVVCNQCKK